MHENSILRPIFSFFIAVLAIGYYITGSPLWGYQTRWTNPRYIQFRISGLRNFTESELAHYDGANGKDIYLAVNGKVFDVSARPDNYGPLGSYHFFSGKDAARAFGTGCFAEDLTHDLRGLDDKMLAAVDGWQKFFDNHNNYWHVGYVVHPPLKGPPPPLCEAARRTADNVRS